VSTRKGRVFEHVVVSACAKFGLKAKRRLLSGSGLKNPYDVRVSGATWDATLDHDAKKRLFPLYIEAKRRMTSDSFTLDGEWLADIGKRKILVFAAGKHPGVQLRLLCVALGHETGIPTLTVRKYKTLTADQMKPPSRLNLVYGDKRMVMTPLDDYLFTHGYGGEAHNGSNSS
jgi:hypothetical protein